MKFLRAASAGWGEVLNFVPKLWALARQLFNEVMGVVFLALTLFLMFGAQGLIHTYRQLDERPDTFWRLLALCGIVLLLGWFGVSSFLRARKISRQG
jgi:branched-subunit amino acid ABC-type transport system permease component